MFASRNQRQDVQTYIDGNGQNIMLPTLSTEGKITMRRLFVVGAVVVMIVW
jgi:hypothetical protein